MVPERGIHPCAPVRKTAFQKIEEEPIEALAITREDITPNTTPNATPNITSDITPNRESAACSKVEASVRGAHDKRYRDAHKAKRSTYMREYMRKRRAAKGDPI
jgi:hypothetical protein